MKQLILQLQDIGVSDGVQIAAIGPALKYEEAVGRRDLVIGAIDIVNARNSFLQRPAFVTLVDMAREDEALIPLVMAMQATM